MTRQQQVYRELHIYRVRIDYRQCVKKGLRFAMVTAGALKTADAVRGKWVSHYPVCLN